MFPRAEMALFLIGGTEVEGGVAKDSRFNVQASIEQLVEHLLFCFVCGRSIHHGEQLVERYLGRLSTEEVCTAVCMKEGSISFFTSLCTP